MDIEVIATRRAQQQAGDLDRTHALVFKAFVDDLARNGCAALGYRLTGPIPISRMCVKHLRGPLRVVVAFESQGRSRDKPPCCGDDGQPPPELGDDLADFIIRAAKRRRRPSARS
jgi:hypothetical protein